MPWENTGQVVAKNWRFDATFECVRIKIWPWSATVGRRLYVPSFQVEHSFNASCTSTGVTPRGPFEWIFNVSMTRHQSSYIQSLLLCLVIHIRFFLYGIEQLTGSNFNIHVIDSESMLASNAVHSSGTPRWISARCRWKVSCSIGIQLHAISHLPRMGYKVAYWMWGMNQGTLGKTRGNRKEIELRQLNNVLEYLISW